MSHNLTKVNSQPGLSVSLNTDNVQEGTTNLYYTETRGLATISNERTDNPTYQDKHFYTIGELSVKQGTLYWRIIHDLKITKVIAHVKTPSIGVDISIHVVKNDNVNPSDLLYDLDIQATQNQVTNNTDKNLVAGDFIRIDIVQIGTTVKGNDLTVSFQYQSDLS